MAFISSTTTTFLGQRSLGKSTSPLYAERAQPTPSMKFGLDKMLSKYAKMAAGGPTDSSYSPTAPSQPSSVWQTFSKSVFAKFAPTRREFGSGATLEDMMSSLRAMAFNFVAPGGTPRSLPGDQYMAGVVRSLYKRGACTSGVYSVRCTEGTFHGQAEDSRVSALAMEFRMRQRTTSQKFGDFFETRRRAISAAHMCSYEERLNTRFPATAAAVVLGEAEAMGACVRYSTGADAAETYMVGCVDKQSKFRAVPYGVYDGMCMDGSAKGLAENKRIVACSAKFRSGQMGKIALAQAKYDASKYARDNFSHMCSYEEALFNKYPAMAGAMRPTTVRYN